MRTLAPGLCGLAAAALLTVQAPVAAQGISGLRGGGDKPLEIDADEGIEWRRDTNQYIARGNARAAQGDLEVFADALTAFYRPGSGGGGTDIHRIDVEGNVRIVTPKERAYGDLGRYDVERGLLVLWGDGLRFETAEDTITARDSLEYWENEQVAVARGDAVATREDKRVRGDIMTARFTEDASGDLAIDRVDINGNVLISTPQESVRGDKGIYFVRRQFATLTGDVKITRGDNQLNGRYAEVNLKTGVSKLRGAVPGQAGSRVRGLLVPRRKPEESGGS